MKLTSAISQLFPPTRSEFRQTEATVSKSAINRYYSLLQHSKSLVCDLSFVTSSLFRMTGYTTELDLVVSLNRWNIANRYRTVPISGENNRSSLELMRSVVLWQSWASWWSWDVYLWRRRVCSSLPLKRMSETKFLETRLHFLIKMCQNDTKLRVIWQIISVACSAERYRLNGIFITWR